MRNETMRGRLPWPLLILSFSVLLTRVCTADVVYNVSMDTAPLKNNAAGPFSLEFQFTDGSGASDGNNTITLDQFSFGADGGLVGAPSTFGSTTGDLATSLSFTDSSFFNQFIQEFKPGNELQFRLTTTTNIDPGGVPDEFTFSILDNSGTELPTLGFFDVFVQLDISSAKPTPQSFASDTSRAAAGGAPVDLSAPSISAVPEPRGGLLVCLFLLLALGAVGGLRDRN
jgi:hypothetical protein